MPRGEGLCGAVEGRRAGYGSARVAVGGLTMAVLRGGAGMLGGDEFARAQKKAPRRLHARGLPGLGRGGITAPDGVRLLDGGDGGRGDDGERGCGLRHRGLIVREGVEGGDDRIEFRLEVPVGVAGDEVFHSGLRFIR